MAGPAPSLQNKVQKWLEKQGYILEMKVASAFRRHNFRVHQAYFFEDPETGKSREIDVLVTKQSEVNERIVRVVFVIECKDNSDKPWVVFGDQSIRLQDPDRVRHRATSFHGRKLLEAAAKSDPLIADTGLFKLSGLPGYAVTAALVAGQGKDTAYHAISAVTTATRALAKALDDSPIAAVLFPVVVVDGQLFTCHLAGSGDVVVESTPSNVVVWRKAVATAPRTIVHVVTMSDLDKLVEAAVSTAHHLFDLDAKMVGEALGRPRGRIEANHPAVDF